MNAYNSVTVAKVLGVTLRKLGYWDRTNLVKPSVSSAQGRGTRRLYSFTDVVELRTVQELRKEGISLARIRKAVAFLRTRLPRVVRPLVDLKFITDGVGVFVLTKDPAAVLDALNKGQLVHAVPVGRYYEAVQKQLGQMVRAEMTQVRVGDFTYRVTLEADALDGGFIVSCPALKGCHSQGETREEALEMIKDAIAAHEEIGVERQARRQVRRTV